MNEAPVSVIIPTFNRSRLVLRAIDSALNQTFPAAEVIVVNDGSTDDTQERIQKRYRNTPCVRYFEKSNGGVSSARNLGLRKSRGAFVALLDADDLWLPDKLQLQLACLHRFPDAGMVWSDMAAIDSEGTVIHPRYLRKMYSAYRYFPALQALFEKQFEESDIGRYRAYCGDIFSPMILGNLVHTSTVLIRRERLQKAGFFDETLRTGEDYPFHLKICREGPVAFLDAVTIHYSIGLPDSLTSPSKLADISVAFLKTFESSLKNDRSRIELSPNLIRTRRAEAYAWAGQEQLRQGRSSGARTYFLKSLRYDPARLLSVKGLILSFFPAAARTALHTLKRKLTGLSLRSSSRGSPSEAFSFSKDGRQ